MANNYNKSKLILVLVALMIIDGVTAVFDKALKCRDEECEIPEEHFSLYSRAKQAFDSEFDFKNGKEIIAFSNAIRILYQRYDNADDFDSLPGSKVIRDRILARPDFQRALLILSSDEGRSLIDLYRVKLNDKKYNSSCSSARIARIKRGENLFKENSDLKWMFEKLHKSFANRSALKCLKYSCSSVNTAMTSINPESTKWSTDSPIMNSIDREFKKQELALCQFITGTNDSMCRIEASELAQFKVENSTQIEALLAAYVRNRAEISVGNQNLSVDKSKQTLLSQCRTMEKSLDEALFGLKWFSQQHILSDQQVETRRYWCPELSYWIEVDRICKQLPAAFEGKFLDNSSTTTTPDLSYNVIDSNEI